MRKIIKTTTIALAVALAISPMMANTAEAGHDDYDPDTKDYLIIVGVSVVGYS